MTAGCAARSCSTLRGVSRNWLGQDPLLAVPQHSPHCARFGKAPRPASQQRAREDASGSQSLASMGVQHFFRNTVRSREMLCVAFLKGKVTARSAGHSTTCGKCSSCLKLIADCTQTSLPACGKTIPAIYNSGSGLPPAAPSMMRSTCSVGRKAAWAVARFTTE